MPCEANSVKDVEEDAGSQGSGWVLPGEPAPQETAETLSRNRRTFSSWLAAGVSCSPRGVVNEGLTTLVCSQRVTVKTIPS